MAKVRRGWLVHRDRVERLMLCRWPKMEDSLMMPCFCYEESSCRKEERKEVEVGRGAALLYYFRGPAGGLIRAVVCT